MARTLDDKCSICGCDWERNHTQKAHQGEYHPSCFKKGQKTWLSFLPKNHPKKKEILEKSLVTRRKLGVWYGEKNANWKGGKTSLKYRIYATQEHKVFIQSILKRDNYICQWCDYNKGHILEVHHIIPVRENMNLIADETNCITLCKDCHKKTYWKEELFAPIFNLIMANKRGENHCLQ